LQKSTVSIAKCKHYDISELGASLKSLLDPLGGIGAFVKPGDKVLLKLNLLRCAEPGKAITTHPAFIEAVINIVRDAGGTPSLGDSPGGPNKPKQIEKALEACGIAALCERTGTEFILFDDETTKLKSPEGKLYTSFTVGKAVEDADVVISLPKLKTHGFMRFTGAVKVLFGVIPGLEKAQFHLKVPERLDFADMLLDIYLAVKPSLSIMDAVVGMEGEGPSGGTPRHIGTLLASGDAIAMDFIASKIIGFDPLDVYTNRAAVYRGLIGGMEGIEVVGTPLSEVKVEDFKAPTSDLADKMPARLVKLLKNIATAKPYLESPLSCTRCATCKQSCPNDAIELDHKQAIFDYDKCIRCYCCEELCPELAIKRKNHWAVSLVKSFSGK